MDLKTVMMDFDEATQFLHLGDLCLGDGIVLTDGLLRILCLGSEGAHEQQGKV